MGYQRKFFGKITIEYCTKCCTTFITTLFSIIYHCASWNLFFNFVESIIAYTMVHFDGFLPNDEFSIICNLELFPFILNFPTDIDFGNLINFQIFLSKWPQNLDQTIFCQNRSLCFSLFGVNLLFPVNYVIS